MSRVPESVPFPGAPEVPDRIFRGYQQLIYREAGIHLGPAKKALLVGRLSRRLRELGDISLSEYLKRAEEDAAERMKLVEAICTHETHFFREPKHFQWLERELLPRWRAQGATDSGSRSVRVWSAGCSSGEEPFTLAMVLRRHLPPEEGWRIEILATDLSTRVLERARQALWPLDKAREIPTEYLKSFMLKGVGSQEGRMKAGPELRELVRFQRLNLHADDYEVSGRFDLVFCRNVLIYFDAASKQRALERLLSYLGPAGYLFIGHAESLTGLTHRVRLVMPTVYAVRANQ
ncbi:CheR family methyltransferase [Hyalangium rubrum]|uniref:protein-glutamate O-methyltransferase n=1 Tax=Hyalangium rubrum TaxID=3103134 RepID=A0ABU5H881_9BACT|nr:protein-glutamate O-methyltransferase CheR [Hyalangium sp. s54d21]MDY7228295.1 protein-glutamate O-methyltransferase CheR [Hyalangium sp. s54d21]